jgi:Holliday junction resolvase
VGRGHDRERDMAKRLKADGYIVMRAAGSLGPIDVVAMRWDKVPQFLQIKSDVSSPYANFRPAERAELVEVAEQAGANAWLVWWPPDRRGPRWIAPSDWPQQRPTTPVDAEVVGSNVSPAHTSAGGRRNRSA